MDEARETPSPIVVQCNECDSELAIDISRASLGSRTQRGKFEAWHLLLPNQDYLVEPGGLKALA
jgi:hypothetical protein